MACPRCRTVLASTEPEPPAAAAAAGRADLAAVRARLLGDLPGQAAVRPGSPARRVQVLLGSAPGAFWGWTGAVAFVLAAAVLLDIAGVPLTPFTPFHAAAGPTAAWLQLLAPLLPIVGVACSYGSGDPAQELLASTPAGGLRLLLYRCAAVLGVSVPAAAAVGLVTGGVDGAAWLLPALALTSLTLALGSVVPLRAAAAVSGGVWAAVMGEPLLNGVVPRAITAQAAPAWGVALLVGAAVVITRAGSLPRPDLDRPDRSVPPTGRTPTA